MINWDKFDVTEEQKTKLKALEKKYGWRRGFKTAFKFVFSIISLTLLTFALSYSLKLNPPFSTGFLFTCNLLNGYICGSMIFKEFKKISKEVKEDVRKVFEE
jgi:hypothetical protein